MTEANVGAGRVSARVARQGHMAAVMAILLTALSLLASCQESLEERCQREAREYTLKRCPAPIGQWTTLDSMTFDAPSRTICYSYTLSGPADSLWLASGGESTRRRGSSPEEPAPAAALAEKARKTLLSQLKNATSLRHYQEARFNFQYVYYSKSHPGDTLFHALLTADDYGE